MRDNLYLDSLQKSAPHLSATSVNYRFLAKIAVFILVFLLFLSIFLTKIFFEIYYILNIIYILLITTKTGIFFFGLSVNDAESNELPNDKPLPTYSILIPLYKETGKIKNLLNAIGNFDYDLEKIRVLILMEEEDVKTIEIARELILNLKYRTEIIIVPKSFPKTKPKACNYGLKFVNSDFVTIYDAEDIPQSNQLKRVLAVFDSCGKNVICIQAILRYYNYKQNWVTQTFDLEYSAWFDVIIKSLNKMDVLIPLGGTSNHFKVRDLKKIYAWDSYNVTEDADLGVRIAKFGYKSRIVNSITYEEAIGQMSVWIKQRSRWIKGFLQTFVVHSKHPIKLLKEIGWKNFLSFQIFVGISGITFIAIIFSIINICLIICNQICDIAFYRELRDNVLYDFSLFVTITSIISMYLATCVLNRRYFAVIYTIFLPIYIGMYFASSIKAIFDLIFRPFHWEKTKRIK